MDGIKQVRKGGWKYDFRDDEDVRHSKQTFRTREEADRALRDCLDKLDRGTYVSPAAPPAFGELAEEWFLSKNAHHPASRAQWREHLDLDLLPRIG